MPAYKYTLKNGKTMWYANFYYTEWTGQKKHVCKRGFKTQRDAKAYEDGFLSKLEDKSDILFSSLVDNYMEDMGHRLKPTTISSKEHIIGTKILPYFKDLKTCDIDTVKVRKWQNALLEMRDEDGNRYKETYLRSIHNQLSAILNYAVRHYGLRMNPCHAAGAIGKDRAEEMNIWTKEEFEAFLETVSTNRMRIAFELLFYSGMREGELLALAPEDFIPPHDVRIRKNYVRLKGGEERILEPKTERSKRTVSLPESLYDEVQEHIKMLYGIQAEDRIFEFTKTALFNAIKKGADKAGLQRIRVHDLRHSNASMLINMGVDIMEISRRLGHESTKTTWDTYGHLYPNKEQELSKSLDDIRSSGKNKSKDLTSPE